ncbi:hypothetical protein [Massilia sp. S19_KUP03_FR1]|uniref:hypothetical protein n=1 Tax=Massilia sp. S19_KUP03_FR1 TaxID=3025503 RepID=UPI002FCD6DD3
MSEDHAIRNPFPSEAVASYGVTRSTCTSLPYMRELQGELIQYLKDYQAEPERAGMAIGVRGVYGSGKTHVLSWLAALMSETRTIRGTVAYGICNTNRFADLCYQLTQSFGRGLVIELIQLALLNLARTKVQSLKVTEELIYRLGTIDGLQALQEEGNIDLEQLRQQLLMKLQTNAKYSDIPRVLLDVTDPLFGDDAHRWLMGDDVVNLARLGVSAGLHGAGDDGNAERSSEGDTRAIAALESIAALHRIAGVPLVVLVDQLQVLLGQPYYLSYDNANALLNQFVEQLKRQSTMVVVAGTHEAWQSLKPDVPARFKQREQIVVGVLPLAETQLLLDAYTAELPLWQRFGTDAIAVLHELSGGLPREILRIAHHAFETARGELARLDGSEILESARTAGTIADRARKALAIADALFPEYGTLSREVLVAGQLVDRLLLSKGGVVIAALVLVKATDSLDEIDSARRVLEIQQYRHVHWSQAKLLIVSVGYASDDAFPLLGLSTPAIRFAEKTFESELRARLLAIHGGDTAWPVMAEDQRAAPQPAPALFPFSLPAGETVPSPDVDERISGITARLQELEQMRDAEHQRIQERFSTQADALSAPTIRDRQMSTRREVLDALDALLDALLRHDTDAERHLIRTILIANETSLHNAGVEDIGDLYIELLMVDRQRPDNQSTSSERGYLVSHMRRSLRNKSTSPSLVSDQRLVFLALGALAVAFLVSGYFSSTWVAARFSGSRAESTLLLLPYPVDFISTIPFVILSIAVALAYAHVMYLASTWRERRIYREHVARVRDRYGPSGAVSTMAERYPQSK